MAPRTRNSFLTRLSEVARRLKTTQPVPCWTEYLRETAPRGK